LMSVSLNISAQIDHVWRTRTAMSSLLSSGLLVMNAVKKI
jgi:hypothetical protein